MTSNNSFHYLSTYWYVNVECNTQRNLPPKRKPAVIPQHLISKLDANQIISIVCTSKWFRMPLANFKSVFCVSSEDKVICRDYLMFYSPLTEIIPFRFRHIPLPIYCWTPIKNGNASPMVRVQSMLYCNWKRPVKSLASILGMSIPLSLKSRSAKMDGHKKNTR